MVLIQVFLLENIVCPSSATSINDCTYITERQFDDDTCFYSAGVVCSSCLSGTEGEVRLVGGRTPCEGYVMVYHSGQWGYLDSDEMSRRVANAVCVSAGYTEADYYDTYSSRTTTFGSGATSFFNRFSVTNIQCGSSSGIPLTSCSYITDNGAFSGSGLAKVACRGGAFCTYNSWNPLGYYSGNQYSGGVYIDGQIVGGVRDDDNYLYIYIPVVVVFVLIVLSCTCMVRRRRLRMLAAGNAAAAVSAGSYAMKAFGTTTATAFVGGGHQQIMLTAQPAGGAQAASLPTAIPQVGMVPSPSVEVTTANSSSPSAAVTMNNPYATVHSPPQVYSQYLPDTDNVTL